MTRFTRKSEWSGVYVGDDRSRQAVLSWFGCMADGLTPYKAEVLCEIATDREKKIRAFVTDADNKHYQLERTLGRKTFFVSRKVIPGRAALSEPGR